MLNNSKQHVSVHFMPGSVLSNNALMLIYWVLTATVWSIRFTSISRMKKRGTERLNNLPRVTQLERATDLTSQSVSQNLILTIRSYFVLSVCHCKLDNLKSHNNRKKCSQHLVFVEWKEDGRAKERKDLILSFPDGSDGKEAACRAGNLGLIPGSGRFPGEGNGYCLQYSCLENSMDRGTMEGYSP